jgi:hypothetical protein
MGFCITGVSPLRRGQSSQLFRGVQLRRAGPANCF